MVGYERSGSAAVVTIDRRERRNAVDGETAAALLAAYERFAADDDARVMVLTGAGDLDWFFVALGDSTDRFRLELTN